MTDSEHHHPASCPAYRIGHGYDVHRFGDGDFLILGGVKIPFHHGFIAHSDGDVLIHSLCDALLGSIAAGDIGQHFPDNDARFKDIDSRILLNRTYELVRQKNYGVANIDITIIAQRPKLLPYIESMRESITSLLDLDKTQINIKATTTEGLGFVGKEQGIEVHSVVVIEAK